MMSCWPRFYFFFLHLMWVFFSPFLYIFQYKILRNGFTILIDVEKGNYVNSVSLFIGFHYPTCNLTPQFFVVIVYLNCYIVYLQISTVIWYFDGGQRSMSLIKKVRNITSCTLNDVSTHPPVFSSLTTIKIFQDSSLDHD